MVGVALLIIMIVISSIGFAMKRNYKMFAVMIIVLSGFILAFIWFFTKIPYDCKLIKTPNIEFLKIRHTTDKEKNTYLYHAGYNSYIVEFLADMRMEECRKGVYRIYYLISDSDITYEDILDNEDCILMESEDVVFIGKHKGKYLYNAPFQLFKKSNDLLSNKVVDVMDITKDIRCKIFIIGVLQPILNTSEMKIPIDSLRKIVKNSE